MHGEKQVVAREPANLGEVTGAAGPHSAAMVASARIAKPMGNQRLWFIGVLTFAIRRRRRPSGAVR